MYRDNSLCIFELFVFVFFLGRIVVKVRHPIQTKTRKIERRAKDRAETKIASHPPERHRDPKSEVLAGN